MANHISIVNQKYLVPNGNVNGIKLYRDYGMQLTQIFNVDAAIPALIMEGMTPSGQYEIEASTAFGKITAMGVGQLEPEIKHIPHWDSNKEGSGIIEHSGVIAP